MTPLTQIKSSNWRRENQHYLMREVEAVRQALKRQIDRINSNGETSDQSIAVPTISPQDFQPPPALKRVCETFGLSPFERDILLLCAGMEFDSNWASLCAAAAGNPQQNYPTFSLALAVLPAPHWGALTPAAPLRKWRLIEISPANNLTSACLRIDERILHYIAGVQHLDERLAGIIEPVIQRSELVPSHRQITEQMVAAWVRASQAGGELPVLQLCGGEIASKKTIAAAVCAELNLNLHTVSAQTIPTDSSQQNLFKCLCEREWLLSDSVLLLDCDETDTTQSITEATIARFIESANLPLIVTSLERMRQRQRPIISFDVGTPTSEEQRTIWQNALGEMAKELNGKVEHLVSHFNLTGPAIKAACLKIEAAEKEEFYQQLWENCRLQARTRLDDLAQRIEGRAGWEDLILPDKERMILQEIAAHVGQRWKVYEQWGFSNKSRRGLGISALFAGGSGTGKTTAAEVLAQELKLDLYRIDLSSVVSKYIGETEKNLRRLFDAAEAGGAILLFDEADALFGKRSEVKDSHDRHANIEVSYLLQRMESYGGLAILTTNLKSALDGAFLRRLRFIVQFPFPDAGQRAEIWRRVFPKQTPTEGLDFNKLAKLNVAGGNIKNMALNAAFIAAEAGEPVGMKHILQAAKSEYVKMERPLTDSEVKGWV
ncbi:ATP-binding protein [Ancylothrix sp. C2]|uniref:ATP-binding protein n=1 Tax=Ancylothrix sp. D3o TaxID=2953691 RepID=UPI0021BA83C6|nr:ATP-binding protein [Ancylothrix sp. D3o]MCT7948240.1 ATP-binding protein [Ancylothrix sp. D3o]